MARHSPHKLSFFFSKPDSTKSSTRKTPPSRTHLTHTPPTVLAKTALRQRATLEEKDRDMCEGKITEKETAEALKDMKNGSSPGCDGFTTELYKTFRQYIKEILVESFEHSFEVGHASQTQKRGTITLIHTGKDFPRDNLASWRPVTLLNTDYKILAKALA